MQASTSMPKHNNKNEGASITRSRQGEVILEELRKLKSHPRSDELYLLVRQRLPKISLGTIYRNLNRFQREGLIAEIYCGEFVRYDGNVSPHDHFLCRSCRRVWDFGREDGQPLAREYIAQDGFQIEGYYTVFYGLCGDCRG